MNKPFADATDDELVAYYKELVTNMATRFHAELKKWVSTNRPHLSGKLHLAFQEVAQEQNWTLLQGHKPGVKPATIEDTAMKVIAEKLAHEGKPERIYAKDSNIPVTECPPCAHTIYYDGRKICSRCGKPTQPKGRQVEAEAGVTITVEEKEKDSRLWSRLNVPEYEIVLTIVRSDIFIPVRISPHNANALADLLTDATYRLRAEGKRDNEL